MEHARHFFNAQQILTIETAIAASEKLTSGELRVHIETACQGNVLDRAAELFAELEMHKTELRNGVLFYLAVRDHKFAVIGDAGINAKVPADFWDQVKVKMQIKFRAGHFTEGLVEALEIAGKHLAIHFPIAADDRNELSNRISFGD